MFSKRLITLVSSAIFLLTLSSVAHADECVSKNVQDHSQHSVGLVANKEKMIRVRGVQLRI